MSADSRRTLPRCRCLLMIAETGFFALLLALAMSILLTASPLAWSASEDRQMMALTRPLMLAMSSFVVLAFAMLTTAYVVSDFSVATVAENSHSTVPLIFKVTGVWGNHEGSMLLWALILAIFGALVALFGDGLPARLHARVLSVQGLIAAAFLAFIVFTSNPFLQARSRRRRKGRTSTRCCRTSASRSTRRFSISAMSASPSPSPSRSRR